MENLGKKMLGIAPLCLEGGLQMSGYTNKPLGIFLILLSVALLIYAFWPEIKKTGLGGLFGSKILLSEAALKAYEEFRGTSFGRIVEGLNSEAPVGYYVYALAENALLYGTHPPSRKQEIVDGKKMGYLSQDGTKTCNVGGNTIYADLMIEKKHFKKYILENKE